MPYPLHVLVNDFAIRSFRDTGDQDYIAARLCYRSGLIPQFLWAGLQALEKYLKCISVLNRVSASKGHDLGRLVKELHEKGKLDLGLSTATSEFIDHLDAYGRHRYFEASWSAEGHELIQLDWAVWEVRRFARTLVPFAVKDEDERTLRREQELAAIKASDSAHPHLYSLNGGLLEKIMTDRSHKARDALVWQNGCFGQSRRTAVKIWPGLHASNSPLFLHPEILDEVLKYVWLPKDVIAAYRALER